MSEPMTVEKVNELVGDDIAYWLGNPFMTSEMLAYKVCWWVSTAMSAAVADEVLAREEWKP